MIVFSSQILLNLLYLLQVNFWKQVNYVFSLISLIASSYCLACPFIFSPHFGLISFLHSLIFSEFSYIPLLFSSLLPSLYSFFPLSLTFFSIKNRCLQYSHFFRLQFYFWDQQERWENIKFFKGKRKSGNKSRGWSYQDLGFPRLADLLHFILFWLVGCLFLVVPWPDLLHSELITMVYERAKENTIYIMSICCQKTISQTASGKQGDYWLTSRLPVIPDTIHMSSLGYQEECMRHHLFVFLLSH